MKTGTILANFRPFGKIPVDNEAFISFVRGAEIKLLRDFISLTGIWSLSVPEFFEPEIRASHSVVVTGKQKKV